MTEKKDVKIVVEWLNETGLTPVKPPRQKSVKAKASKKTEKSSAKKADKCKGTPAASPEYGYPNLALCVIDAVFSSRGQTATGPVCAFVEWAARTGMKPSATGRKLTPGALSTHLEGVDAGELADTVFGCSTRALGCPDLSRAQVVVELCRNLAAAGVSTKGDARDLDKREALGRAVTATRGFGASGEARLIGLAIGPAVLLSAVEALSAAAPGILGREIDTADAVELKDKVVRRLRKSMPGLSEADIVHHLWRVGAGFAPGFTCG